MDIIAQRIKNATIILRKQNIQIIPKDSGRGGAAEYHEIYQGDVLRFTMQYFPRTQHSMDDFYTLWMNGTKDIFSAVLEPSHYNRMRDLYTAVLEKQREK